MKKKTQKNFAKLKKRKETKKSVCIPPVHPTLKEAPSQRQASRQPAALSCLVLLSRGHSEGLLPAGCLAGAALRDEVLAPLPGPLVLHRREAKLCHGQPGSGGPAVKRGKVVPPEGKT